MHSPSIRERALTAYDSGKGSLRDIAAMFGIGLSSLVRWQKQRRDTGSVKPTKRRGHNPPRVRSQDEALVRELVASNNDFTVEEFTIAFVSQTGRQCSPSAMGRALRRLGLTRKKSR